MSNYQDAITLGEIAEGELSKLESNNQQSNTTMIDITLPNLVPTEDKIMQGKDDMERRTGIFHWRFPGDKYKAIDRMSDKECNIALAHAEKRMDECYQEVERQAEKVQAEADKLEMKFDEMCKWMYRHRQVEDEVVEREETEATERPKFQPRNIRADIVEDAPSNNAQDAQERNYRQQKAESNQYL